MFMVVFTFIAHVWFFCDFSSLTASDPIHFHCFLVKFSSTKEGHTGFERHKGEYIFIFGGN